MIKFQQEYLREMAGELIPFLSLHYEELTQNKDRVKLSPRWDRYLQMEDSGNFVIFTARDGKRLVGYNAFFIDTHMHYEDLLVAANDVFYIAHEQRQGSTPLRFLRFTRDALRDIRDQRDHLLPLKVAYHFKAGNNFGAILDRLGYRHEEGVAAEIL